MTMKGPDDAPATKGDLRQLREELSLEISGYRGETKSEISGLRGEMKSEIGRLDQTCRGLAVEIVKTNGRIDRLEDNLRGEIRDGNSRILKTVEDFMGQVGKVDRRQIIMDWRVDQLDKRVKGLEARQDVGMKEIGRVGVYAVTLQEGIAAQSDPVYLLDSWPSKQAAATQ